MENFTVSLYHDDVKEAQLLLGRRPFNQFFRECVELVLSNKDAQSKVLAKCKTPSYRKTDR